MTIVFLKQRGDSSWEGSVNAVLSVLIAGTCQTAGHRGCVGPGFPGCLRSGLFLFQ